MSSACEQVCVSVGTVGNSRCPFLEAACHFEEFQEWNLLCAFVSRRPVATEGGKWGGLYVSDRDMAGWRKTGVYSGNILSARWKNFPTHVCVPVSSPLPQPAVQFPGCQRCWCRGGRPSPFVWKVFVCWLGTPRSSAGSVWAPGRSHCPLQTPAASPHRTAFPVWERQTKTFRNLKYRNTAQTWRQGSAIRKAQPIKNTMVCRPAPHLWAPSRQLVYLENCCGLLFLPPQTLRSHI